MPRCAVNASIGSNRWRCLTSVLRIIRAARASCGWSRCNCCRCSIICCWVMMCCGNSTWGRQSVDMALPQADPMGMARAHATRVPRSVGRGQRSLPGITLESKRGAAPRCHVGIEGFGAAAPLSAAAAIPPRRAHPPVWVAVPGRGRRRRCAVARRDHLRSPVVRRSCAAHSPARR